MQEMNQPQMNANSVGISALVWHHPTGPSCYTSQLPLRSGVGRRLALEPLVEGRPAWSSPVPMYPLSNRNLGVGMAIPRTGLVWKRRLMQSSTSAISPAATTTLETVSKAVSLRSPEAVLTQKSR
jgi:hypothetical protein